MAHPVTAPSNLPDLVRTAFARARTAGDLTFFPTQVALLRVNDIPFQLRFAPSLAKKPKPPQPAAATTASQPAAARFDPFAEPQPGLLVLPQLGSSSGATHRLVLNKFAICRDHAILATTDFRPQDHLLAADDLAAAYACIEAYHASPSGSEELFVFYNSGAHSGASQPHRHLQMLPVACMREGLEGDDASAWNVLADQLLQQKGSHPAAAGFYVAAAPVRQDGHSSPSAEALHALYLHLYRKACAAAGLTSGEHSTTTMTTEEEEGRIPARLSYNLAMTRTTMALCPRTAEGGNVSAQGGTAAGSLSLNGTVLAGTALVKNEAEWTALRQDPGQLAQVLRQIGVPSDIPRPGVSL